MFGFGIAVKWFSLTRMSEIIGIFMMIVVIYGINCWASYHRDTRIANQMNQKLSEYQNQKEE